MSNNSEDESPTTSNDIDIVERLRADTHWGIYKELHELAITEIEKLRGQSRPWTYNIDPAAHEEYEYREYITGQGPKIKRMLRDSINKMNLLHHLCEDNIALLGDLQEEIEKL